MSKDGGPAFPLVYEYMDEHGTMRHVDEGMTLRDYFAIHADQPGQDEILDAAGLRFSDKPHRDTVVDDEGAALGSFSDWYRALPSERKFELYSIVRYRIAAAMLAQREKEAQ